MTATDRLLTIEEIAARTRKSVDTIRWYRHLNSGPRMFRLGRRVVAREADVEKWIAEQYAADHPQPAG